MAAEYNKIELQTVAEDENILFLDGNHFCKNGLISHRANSGVFRLKCVNNCCKTIYRVTFNANIAVAEGGTVGAISVALQEDGETVGNTISIVTPAAIGDFFSVSFSTFIVIPCGCCVTVSVENTSDGTAIDVANANIIFDRVA